MTMDRRTRITAALLYLWQLPQNLLGLLFLLILRPDRKEQAGVVFHHSPRMRGGISLGDYIIVGDHYTDADLWHEEGHRLQSLLLGWLYLPVVGLPSLVWATLYGRVIKATPGGYYRFWTEKWADRLGDVKR